ncbi:hypothetical protein FHK02_1466 [Spirosoma sp. LMG 31448]|nr:hypothetical protein [Spirosoma utsteinense]
MYILILFKYDCPLVKTSPELADKVIYPNGRRNCFSGVGLVQTRWRRKSQAGANGKGKLCRTQKPQEHLPAFGYVLLVTSGQGWASEWKLDIGSTG